MRKELEFSVEPRGKSKKHDTVREWYWSYSITFCVSLWPEVLKSLKSISSRRVAMRSDFELVSYISVNSDSSAVWVFLFFFVSVLTKLSIRQKNCGEYMLHHNCELTAIAPDFSRRFQQKLPVLLLLMVAVRYYLSQQESNRVVRGHAFASACSSIIPLGPEQMCQIIRLFSCVGG